MMDTTEVNMKIRAFTVKAHWGLLIRSGIKTCENRSFRVPSDFYLVHASSSLSFSEWCEGSKWVQARFGDRVSFPGFDECRSWCGQMLCGVRVLSALTQSADPWFLGGDLVAWELGAVVQCAPGVRAKGFLGVWPVSEDLHHRYLDGVRTLQTGRKVRV